MLKFWWLKIIKENNLTFSSVQFSRSVMSNTLRPHESQHARPPCPSPTPGVYSNSCPLSQWCHPAISFCHPLLLLPPVPHSIRVFSNESTLCMRWPKYTYALIYSICFSPSDSLHSVWQTLGSSTLLQRTQFHFILWLSNIPLYICTTTSLSIHLSMDI